MYTEAEIELKNQMHNLLTGDAFVRFIEKEYFFEKTRKTNLRCSI